MINRLSTAAAVAAALLLLVATPTAAHAKDATASLSLVPSDMQILVGINVTRLKRSPAFAEMTKAGSFKKQMAEMKARGFDPKRDLSSVLVGMVNQDADKGMVFIVDGKFNQRKLAAELRKEKSTQVATHRGVTYYQNPDGQSVAFLGSRFAMTNTDRIKGLIDLHLSKRGGPNSAVKSLLRKVNTKRDFWIVANAPALKGGSGGFGPGKDDLRSVHGSMDVQKGLKVILDIGFKSAAVAQTTMQQLGALKAMAAGEQSLKQMGLDVVVAKLQMSQNAAAIKMSLDLTPAEAKKLKGLANMF